MKNKIVLNNNTEIEIENGSSIGDLIVLSETKQDMIATWDMLTEENLKKIWFKGRDGENLGTYENVVLENETSTVLRDERILTSFHLREKTEVELLREEVEQLKAGQEVQDGAISDLGAAVSGIAEEGGLA